ncbi:MAG: hypothetical protein D6738_06820, partial [Acidobacteria bacterium]
AIAQQEQVPLPELGWDDEIPYSVRHAVDLAVREHVGKLTGAKNDAGKTFIHPYFSNYVEIRDGRPVTWVTLQRCLPDRMVTERIEYVFEKDAKGEYTLAEERKVNEVDRSLPLKIEKLELARPIKPFSFQHDQLSIEMTSGTYVTRYVGDHPVALEIAGKGHVRLTPPDDYQEQFWKRYLDGPVLDADIVGVEIEFHHLDRSFLELIGWTPPGGEVRPFEFSGEDVAAPEKLVERYRELTEDSDEIAWTPRGYRELQLPQYKGTWSIAFETTDGREILYGYSPVEPQEIGVYTVEKGISLRKRTRERTRLVAVYPAPETRALPVDERDRRESLRFVVPNKINARFDIDGDKFIATASLDLIVAEPTDSLLFSIGGNPTVRYVRDLETDAQLPFVPYKNPFSEIFGFEETVNTYRVAFPEMLQPGTVLRIELSYNSPKLVYKFDEGFWRISRQGLIPFSRGLGDPAMMSFVLRTKAKYEHVSFGEKAREEVAGDYRYTEWRSPRGVNFPTMIIGQFYEPITAEVDGVTIEGYATRVRNDQLSSLRVPQKGMKQEVEKARSAIEGYHKIFGVHYPFTTLRVVSVPFQGYAQSPTSILFMDENLLLPEGVIGQYLDPRKWESITAHEAAHQWWGGLVSNTDFFHYWFVESLADLSAALYLEAVKPGSIEVAINDWRDMTLRSEHVCSIKDDILYGGEIGKYRAQPLRYTKGPYVLLMLGEHFGYDKLRGFMQRLLELHRGDLVTTTDLQRVAEQVVGVQLDWYWDQWIRGNGVPTIGYELGSPRREGDKWVLDYRFTQKVVRGDEVLPGKVFRLVIPIHLTAPDGSTKVVRVWLKEAEKAGRLELDFEPRGTPRIDPDNRMLFRRERL